MKTAYVCVTVDDVGLEGYSSPQHLENLLRFWDDQGLKGTIFVVPRCNGKEFSEMKDYLGILASAAKSGHEIAQHGLDHTRFQTGIPPKMVLDLPHEGPAREYLAGHRDEIEASLTVQNLRTVLAAGRRMLEAALPVKIQGFRAPCLSTCENLFAALEAEKYVYDSSQVFQEAAWDLINQPDRLITPRPVTRSRFSQFQNGRTIRMLPIAAEYTWYLKRERYSTFLNLAKHDIDGCLEAGIPFVTLSHVSPIQEGDPGCGFDLYRELIQYARGQAEKRRMTLVAATLAQVAGQKIL